MCLSYRSSLISSALHRYCSCFFFFNDTATTEIYTLSLHDALPIYLTYSKGITSATPSKIKREPRKRERYLRGRSEEHTSELQSPDHLVCRLLLEKKKYYYSHDPSANALGLLLEMHN